MIRGIAKHLKNFDKNPTKAAKLIRDHVQNHRSEGLGVHVMPVIERINSEEVYSDDLVEALRIHEEKTDRLFEEPELNAIISKSPRLSKTHQAVFTNMILSQHRNQLTDAMKKSAKKAIEKAHGEEVSVPKPKGWRKSLYEKVLNLIPELDSKNAQADIAYIFSTVNQFTKINLETLGESYGAHIYLHLEKEYAKMPPNPEDKPVDELIHIPQEKLFHDSRFVDSYIELLANPKVGQRAKSHIASAIKNSSKIKSLTPNQVTKLKKLSKSLNSIITQHLPELS